MIIAPWIFIPQRQVPLYLNLAHSPWLAHRQQELARHAQSANKREHGENMHAKIYLIMAYLSLACILSANSYAASFDCNKAASLSEMMICNDEELSKLDDELSKIYKEAKTYAKDDKAFKDQTSSAWKWREKNCQNKECIRQWYVNRKEILINYINKNKTSANQYPIKKSDLFVVGLSNYKSLKTDLKGSDTYKYVGGRNITIETFFEQLDFVYVWTDEFKNTRRIVFCDVDAGWGPKYEYLYEKTDITGRIIGEYDFDGDNVNEIIIATRYKPSEKSGEMDGLGIRVYKLRGDEFVCIGHLFAPNVLGSPVAEIKMNKIRINRNLRGFYYQMAYEGGRFVDTSDY